MNTLEDFRLGGMTTLERYGAGHFKRLARHSWKQRRRGRFAERSLASRPGPTAARILPKGGAVLHVVGD